MRRTPQAAGGGAAAETAVEGGAWGCGLYARMSRSRPVWAICAASGPRGACPCSPFGYAAAVAPLLTPRWSPHRRRPPVISSRFPRGSAG
jgi:hypothetical protein